MERTLKFIDKCCTVIATVCLAIMVGSIFYQVVARYFFNNPPPWTEELSRYLQIWLICLMAGPLIYLSEHIEIDIVYNIASKYTQRLLDILRHSISFAFALLILYYSILLNLSKKPQMSPAMEISMGWIYWAISIMLILVAINQIFMLLRSFVIKRKID